MNDEGFALTPGGEKIRCQIDVAADLSALWKVTGIGSAGNDKSCLFCDISKAQRQSFLNTGDLRTDLNTVFGLAMDRVHCCILHGYMRIGEKPLKLLAVMSRKKTDSLADEIKTLESSLQEGNRSNKRKGRKGQTNKPLTQDQITSIKEQLAERKAEKYAHGSTDAM